MSETASQYEVPAAPSAPAVEPSVAPVVAARGRGLAPLALLLALAGVAGAGWAVWQLRGLQVQTEQQQLRLVETQAQAQNLSQRAQNLTAQLGQLPSPDDLAERQRLLASVQGDQQRLSVRLDNVLNASRQDWRLAEAEHLLRLASLRLSALQEVNGAKALVQTADDILREQDDPAAFAARAQLAKSLEALRGLQQPDRTGLFLQLGALRAQVAQLNPQTPAFADNGGVLASLAAEGDGSSRWAQWLEQLSHYFRIDFSAAQDIRPLLAGQSLAQVRLSLTLALEQAQWGALNGNSGVYQQALQQARDVLNDQFNQDNPDVQSLRNRLAELLTQPVSVSMPDLTDSMAALQAYVQLRESGSPAAADSAAPALEESSR
ncbi:MAG: uroporphyrinogen-III C-methyltransferase [Pseudomonadaceae bacterium]|nr:uroporphyrinogen-III C-methyltransferase [Pseudomonadaceae bacterium]